MMVILPRRDARSSVHVFGPSSAQQHAPFFSLSTAVMRLYILFCAGARLVAQHTSLPHIVHHRETLLRLRSLFFGPALPLSPLPAAANPPDLYFRTVLNDRKYLSPLLHNNKNLQVWHLEKFF